MEENKVVLKLEDYIKMLDEIKEYKRIAENVSSNYDKMCNYLKEEVISHNEYDIRNVIKDNVNLNDTLNVKLKNYHYNNLANELIKTGISFDLVEKIIDNIIIERNIDKQKEEV